MWWWRCRWSVATTTTVFVLGIATVYSQLEISDLDKPSESYTLYLLFILAMLERAITGNGGIEGGREGCRCTPLLFPLPNFFSPFVSSWAREKEDNRSAVNSSR